MVVIGFISAKGGVGKTTVVANLGIVLSKVFGKNVLLIDSNITTPTLGVILGILSQKNTLDDVLEGSISIQQAVHTHDSGLSFIPASLAPRQSYPDPGLLKERLSWIKDRYDVILVDGAAGIGKEVIAVIDASDFAVVISNPEMPSIVAAIKAIKITRSLGVPIMGLVINKVLKKKHELTTNQIEDLCETKIISTIPYDKHISQAVKNMEPITMSGKGVSIAAFGSLAGILIGKDYNHKQTLFERLSDIIKF